MVRLAASRLLPFVACEAEKMFDSAALHGGGVWVHHLSSYFVICLQST